MSWGSYVAIIVVLIGLHGLYRNARLNKGVRQSLFETLREVAVLLLIVGSIVVAKALLT